MLHKNSHFIAISLKFYHSSICKRLNDLYRSAKFFFDIICIIFISLLYLNWPIKVTLKYRLRLTSQSLQQKSKLSSSSKIFVFVKSWKIDIISWLSWCQQFNILPPAWFLFEKIHFLINIGKSFRLVSINW